MDESIGLCSVKLIVQHLVTVASTRLVENSDRRRFRFNVVVDQLSVIITDLLITSSNRDPKGPVCIAQFYFPDQTVMQIDVVNEAANSKGQATANGTEMRGIEFRDAISLFVRHVSRTPCAGEEFHRVSTLEALSNGSRLSCGRNARGRKETEPQTKRLASEATQFFPTCERPPASSAC